MLNQSMIRNMTDSELSREIDVQRASAIEMGEILKEAGRRFSKKYAEQAAVDDLERQVESLEDEKRDLESELEDAKSQIEALKQKSLEL